jgi:hypothetical protein
MMMMMKTNKVYAVDVSLLAENINTIKENSETLLDANKKVGLDVTMEKAKYMLTSRHHIRLQDKIIL